MPSGVAALIGILYHLSFGKSSLSIHFNLNPFAQTVERNMPDKNTLMSKAISIAESNLSTGGGPFGALVVRDGYIISEGSNLVTVENDPTAHAEVVAIRRACQSLGTFDLSGCEIYASCEPCPMCLSAIYWARLDKLYFAASRQDAAKAGFDDSDIYQQVALDIEERRLSSERLLAFESGAPFDAWAKLEGKTEY